MNGTSTIKHTTSKLTIFPQVMYPLIRLSVRTTHLPKSFKDTRYAIQRVKPIHGDWQLSLVQYLLSRSHRQNQSAFVQDCQGTWQRWNCATSFHRWTTIRRHCFPDCQSRVGILAQAVGLTLLPHILEWSWSFFFSGFRSSFDRGCLSLWFNFRRNVRKSITFELTCPLIWHTPSSTESDLLYFTTCIRCFFSCNALPLFVWSMWKCRIPFVGYHCSSTTIWEARLW